MRVVVYIYIHVQVFFRTPPHSSEAAKPCKSMGTQLSLRSRNRMLLRRRVIGSSLGKFIQRMLWLSVRWSRRRRHLRN